MLMLMSDMKAFLYRRIFHWCGKNDPIIYIFLQTTHNPLHSHGTAGLVPGHQTSGLEGTRGEEDGDLVLPVRSGDSPSEQLERLPCQPYGDHTLQVLAKYWRKWGLPVTSCSWSNCQILRINLKSNSISKNNIQGRLHRRKLVRNYSEMQKETWFLKYSYFGAFPKVRENTYKII